MYNYSPISKVRVKNFRNIGDVELDFSDSPIITLVGSNEAGKTSVIKAFGVCALHASPRDQKEWIRDTTKMFGVQIDLQDGTQIVRVKEDGGVNLYRVIDKDGKTWDTSKITDGLPVQVQQVMGLIAEEETGEFLHIRTYEDKLLFVVTPDSANYKVMYNALKVEQLTKAIKIGSNQVNSIKADVTKNENSLQTLNEQLRGITVLDINDLISLRERLKYQLNMLDKLERAVQLMESIRMYEASLGPIGLIDRFNLQPIDELMASNLVNVSKSINNNQRLKESYSVISDVNTADEINLDMLHKLNGIIERKERLNRKINEAGALVHLKETEMINETLVLQLSKVKDLLDKQGALSNQVEVISIGACKEVTQDNISTIGKLVKVQAMFKDIAEKQEALGKINDYLEQVQEYLKKCGVAVESCPKCGEAVIFDIDKLEG